MDLLRWKGLSSLSVLFAVGCAMATATSGTLGGSTPVDACAALDIDGDGVWDSQCVRSFADADAIWRGGTDAFFGSNPSAVGDVTGDQLADVAVMGFDGGAPLTYVLSDPGTGGTSADAAASVPTVERDPAVEDLAAAAGDENADGTGDLWLPTFDGAEAHLSLIAGPVSGSTTGASIATLPYVVVDHFLGGVDFSGDGAPDLVGSAYDQVHLFRGPFSGSRAVTDAALTLRFSDEAYGLRVRNAGDTDGDGVAEILLDNPALDVISLVDGSGSGSFERFDRDGGAVEIARVADERVGGATGVGDTDGDGYDDIVVGLRAGAATPGCFVLAGPVQGTLDLSTVAATSIVDSTGEGAPDDAIGMGDLTGDGLADWVATGITSVDPSGIADDLAFLVAVPGGSAGGTVDQDTLVVRWTGEPGSAYVTEYVAGDTDGDGLAELFAGASWTAGTSGNEGALYMLAPLSLFP